MYFVFCTDRQIHSSNHTLKSIFFISFSLSVSLQLCVCVTKNMRKRWNSEESWRWKRGSLSLTLYCLIELIWMKLSLCLGSGRCGSSAADATYLSGAVVSSSTMCEATCWCNIFQGCLCDPPSASLSLYVSFTHTPNQAILLSLNSNIQLSKHWRVTVEVVQFNIQISLLQNVDQLELVIIE